MALEPDEIVKGGGAAVPLAETPSLVVTTTADVVADDGETSLREAIGLVNDGTFAPGSTIIFANGAGEAFEEGGLILLGGEELAIRESLTIDGDLDDDGAPDVTVDADERSRAFRVDDGDATTDRDVTLDGLVVTGGRAPEEPRDDARPGEDGLFRGGGIISAENLSISASEFIDNEAARGTYYGEGRGGSIFSTGDNLLIDGSIFDESYSGTEILDEIITGKGGSIYTTSLTKVYRSTFLSNTSGYGGAIYSRNDIAIEDARFERNIAGGYGAGGAVFVADGDLSIVRSSFTDNDSSGNAGAIEHGGGFATIAATQFHGNTASIVGGAIRASGGPLTVADSSFTDNEAFRVGGAIAVASDSSAWIARSSLSGNRAGEGGAIRNTGALTISNSTISGNHASQNVFGDGIGGGVSSAGGLTVINSTIVRNAAEAYGAPGAGDSVGIYGGIALDGGVATLTSTIVAENAGGDLGAVGGGFVSGGRNLIGDGSGGGAFVDGVLGDIVGAPGAPVDPLLSPLGDFGGPTLTHALLAGSPAIDAGADPLGLGFDQRGPGFSRTLGAGTDIGAVEGVVTLGETRARVARSSDDAEQAGPRAAIDLDDGVLEIAASPSKLVGLRFAGLDTPEGAAIVEAYIRFRANRSFDGASIVEIALEDDLAARTFGTGARTIAARDYLEETVAWTPEATVRGRDFRTPDLSGLVETLLAGDDVEAGDAFAFRLTGLGGRNAWSFDGSGPAPELVIVYAAPAAPDGLDPLGLG